jgi:predicted nuclease of predicted toxin-antitoxin system
MRFLADESCDFAVVRALRAEGHAVTTVSEVAAGAPDGRVIAIAIRERAVLLTEDKDFGQLVFAERRATGGVILIRFPAAFRAELPRVVCRPGSHSTFVFPPLCRTHRPPTVTWPSRNKAHAPQ